MKPPEEGRNTGLNGQAAKDEVSAAWQGLDAGKYFWRSGREKCFSLDILFIGLLDNCRGQPIVRVAVQMADESHAEPHAPITTSLRVDQELCLARHFFDRRLPQDLPNIYANLLNGIAPIAEPIPLWRVGLCSACHIRRAGGDHDGTRLLKAGDKLPPLPAVPPPFAN